MATSTLSTDKESACQYKGCGRKVARDGKCIFHLQDKDSGEAKEFNSLLSAEIKRMQQDATLPAIDFRGFRFPRPAYKFGKTRFEKEIDFTETVFEGNAYFFASTFPKGALFDKAEFRGNAVFWGDEFSRNVI